MDDVSDMGPRRSKQYSLSRFSELFRDEFDAATFPKFESWRNTGVRRRDNPTKVKFWKSDTYHQQLPQKYFCPSLVKERKKSGEKMESARQYFSSQVPRHLSNSEV